MTQQFETFFRSEFAPMVALGLAMTGDREAARDLAQDAFARAYEHWERVGRMERPGGWVRRVLVNLAIDHTRRRATRRHHERRPPPRPLLPADQASQEWWVAVRALPDRQRAAVALHYLDDRPIAEVAEILGVAVGTVKSSLAKARRTLQRELGGMR